MLKHMHNFAVYSVILITVIMTLNTFVSSGMVAQSLVDIPKW